MTKQINITCMYCKRERPDLLPDMYSCLNSPKGFCWFTAGEQTGKGQYIRFMQGIEPPGPSLIGIERSGLI